MPPDPSPAALAATSTTFFKVTLPLLRVSTSLPASILGTSAIPCKVFIWRCGLKYTGVWMVCYALLRYFPRMVLLLSHAILAAMIPPAYSTPSPSGSISTKNPPAPIAPPPSEGGIDRQAKLQAKAYGCVLLLLPSSNVYDFLSRLTPQLIHRSAHASLILMLTPLCFLLCYRSCL
ncbi:hypothetical protein EDB19DRAFT_2042736 [Suillus lakei]|nr:hypothetical protein EDB19DRAFT_2042736 [Suillus lakei]